MQNDSDRPQLKKKKKTKGNQAHKGGKRGGKAVSKKKKKRQSQVLVGVRRHTGESKDRPGQCRVGGAARLDEKPAAPGIAQRVQLPASKKEREKKKG
jgi:hypothetical protein